ncbi:MAG: LysM peptidoglycan-binding domain-containing protein, partial [Bacteroidetes bacterium]|nr:LysM peptidoglycan-binding domain-containing protein [Bacteroidota bacterium]
MEKTAKIGYLIITIIALVFGVAISYAQHTLDIEGYKQIAFDSGSNIISHRVGKGDSLTSLAYRYRTTVNDIKQTNKLKRDNIYFGEIL